jgi:hypothetical protein
MMNGWHPMETAPRDGTPLVLVGRMRHDDTNRIWSVLTRWYESRQESPAYEEGWCFSSPGLSDTFDPIAWMPSPVAVDKYNRPLDPQPAPDPVAAIVDAQLAELRPQLIEAGHKYADPQSLREDPERS